MMTLLEYGAFGNTPETRTLTYMSPHKWRQMVKAAEALHILPYISMGAEQKKDDTHLSAALFDSLAEPNRKVSIEPYSVETAHLFNHWTDKKLNDLKEEEMNSHDTSDETLMLLDIIVCNAASMIQRDIDIEGIIALGQHVRNEKENIDYSKLGLWLKRIGMLHMASLMGNILISTFHFKEEELPFVIKTHKNAGTLLMKKVESAFRKHHFPNTTRLNNALVETVSCKFMNAISLVTDIEE